MSCAKSVGVEDKLTAADVERAAAVEVTPEHTAEAYHVGLMAIHEFVRWCVNPVLETLIDPTDEDRALVALQYRTHCLIRTLLALTEAIHFQSIVSASRSVIELHVDMLLIDQKLIPNGINKFYAFTRAQRLRAATRATKFYDTNPTLVHHNNLAVTRQFIYKNALAIDAESGQLWGVTKESKPKIPSHWSGLTLPNRAKLIGPECEKLVIDGYDYRNWMIHSGSSGVDGMEFPTFIAMSALSLIAVHQVMLANVKLLADRLKLAWVIEDLAGRLTVLEVLPGFVLTDVRLQSIGEPQRVRVVFIKEDN